MAEVKDLMNAAVEAAKRNGSKAVNLKAVSKDSNYSAFDQSFFSEGLKIKVPNEIDTWLPGTNGGYWTLMMGIDADGIEKPITVYAKSLFKRVRVVGADGVVQRDLARHQGNFEDYRKNAVTLEAFWSSLKGKTLSISDETEYTTTVFNKDKKWRVGDIVPAEEQTTTHLYTINVTD